MIDVQTKLADRLGPIEWLDSTKGLCKCPGEHLHTTRTGKKDAVIYLESLWINCFHDHCRPNCEKVSRELWADIKRGAKYDTVKPLERSPDAKEQIKLATSGLLDRIMEKYSWIVSAHGFNVLDGGEGDWKIWLALWKENDIIWNGDVFDSGEKHKNNFRTRTDFLRKGPIGNFTCGSSFKPGTFHRTNENVQTSRYLICESDKLTHDQTLATFLFLREFMPMRMIVDAGNKSLHGWFDFPSKLVLKALQVMLPALGFDRQTLKPSQPVRLPGVMRGERWQRIYWIE